VAVGWVGKLRYRKREAVTLDPARVLHAGLAKGSSDLIGWTVVTVTPDMVGKRVAVFTSIEAKTPGVPVEHEQAAWINKVLADGGIAGVVYTVEEYDQIVTRWPGRPAPP